MDRSERLGAGGVTGEFGECGILGGDEASSCVDLAGSCLSESGEVFLCVGANLNCCSSPYMTLHLLPILPVQF